MQLGPRRLAALLVLPVVLLTACGSDSDGASSTADASASSSASGAAPAPAETTTTDLGVTIAGGFGETPTVTVPAKDAPKELVQEVLSEGTGAVVAKGQTLVANYSGQTWEQKDGAVNVFDSSFEKGTPAGFPIGTGSVIPGWDKTLVGKKIGSRVLLSIPAADGYGESGQEAAKITGTDTLVFVIDILGAVSPDQAASGEAVTEALPAGLPKVTSKPGAKPTIDSVEGVKEVTTPTSGLLVRGDGDKIDPQKALAMQLVQTDIATGKETQETWGGGVQVVAAEQVLAVATALKDQNVGSRVVAVTPASTDAQGAATPGVVLVIDVVGQF